MEATALSAIEFDEHFNYDNLNRRQRKRLRRESKKLIGLNKQLDLKYIHPMTHNQKRTFNSFNQGQQLLLHGVAGTGKTFISLYLSLKELMDQGSYEKVVIVRSVVPTRDMGFLPGNQKEKARVYEAPYYSICSELFNRGDAYDIIKNKGYVEFISTSYVRGTTLSDCIVIVDECQNLNFHELDSIITRAGENCRIIFCGDFRQSDLIRESEKKGINSFINVVNNMRSFDLIEFNESDIVRSNLVREYILSKLRHGIYT